MPIRGARFRYRIITPKERQRLAFVGNKVVEVTSYHKRNGSWVEHHTRRFPK